jgi:hypothetical protein
MAAPYQHLSSSFLTEAVGKLDGVLGTGRSKTLPLKSTYLRIVCKYLKGDGSPQWTLFATFC